MDRTKVDVDSNLIHRCFELQKLPLDQFSTEDLRLMIGQGIGLKYLIPISLEILSENLFAEGDYYEGDLLSAVLSVDPKFWSSNANYWNLLENLIADKLPEIEARRINVSVFYEIRKERR